MIAWHPGEAYLMVLIRCHCDEGSFWEHVSAESCVLRAEAVVFICFDNVETRLVFVHGVEYYLRMREREKKMLTDPSCFQQMLVVGQSFLRLNPYGQDSFVFLDFFVPADV